LTVLLNRNLEPPIHITAIEQTETYAIDRGTNVRLSTGSQIEYTKGKRNEVHLKGTATFDVKSNKEKELLVVAGETFIKDIGTIFTVAANDPQKSIIVDVTEGEVLFYTLKDKGLVIKKGERGMYDSETKIFTSLVTEEKRETEDKPSTLKDGLNRISENKEQNTSGDQNRTREQIAPKNVQEMFFDAEPLANIVTQLESLYDVKIEIAPEFSQLPINISFEKEEDIEYILTIISETLSGRLYKNGDTYILSRE
jgi:ferric-dicitrate binding protein FerR (iron transport regulator)